MAKKFIVSTAALDAAFDAGFEDGANAYYTWEVMRDVLTPFSGVCHRDAVDSWEEVRKAFVLGLEAAGMDNVAARQRWSRMIKAIKLDKPQTPEAKAKAKARKAAMPVATVTAAAQSDKPVTTSEPAAVAASARLTACIELLQTLDAEALIKAQGLLLQLTELDAAPF